MKHRWLAAAWLLVAAGGAGMFGGPVYVAEVTFPVLAGESTWDDVDGDGWVRLAGGAAGTLAGVVGWAFGMAGIYRHNTDMAKARYP